MSSSLATPLPDTDQENNLNDAIHGVIYSGAGGGNHDLAVPAQLFAKHFEDAGGIASAIGEKRLASERRTPAVAAASLPAKKKRNTSSSPICYAFAAIARVTAANAAATGVGVTSNNVLLPAISHGHHSLCPLQASRWIGNSQS